MAASASELEKARSIFGLKTASASKEDELTKAREIFFSGQDPATTRDLAPGAFEKLKNAYNPMSGLDPLERLGEASLGFLQGAGAVGQRLEAVRANRLRRLQEDPVGAFDPRKFAADLGGALSGKRLSETGDVLRAAGLPEVVSAAGGLVAEGLSDPTGAVLKSGKFITQGAKKIARATGRTGTRATLSILQGQSDEVIDFMVKDRFKGASSKYLDPTAAMKQARQIAAQTKKYIYRPAAKAFDEAAEGLVTRNVKNVDGLVGRLKTMLESSVGNEAETQRVANLIDKLTAPSFSGNAGELYTFQRSLRKAAGKSVMDAEAVRIIGQHLEDQFPSFAKANRLWSKWSDVLRDQDVVIGKLDKTSGKTLPKASKRLLSYFDDPNRQVATRLNNIQFHLNDASKGQAGDLVTNAQRLAAMKNFKRTAPGFKALAIQSVLGASGLPFNAQAFSVPVAGVGLAVSSPRLFAGLARAGFGGSEKAAKLLNTPLGKQAATLFAVGVGEAAARQVTGRNQ